MKPFRIIITGASRHGQWYADKVGQVFEVVTGETVSDSKEFWVKIGEPPWSQGGVYWRDCELAPQPEAAGHKLIRTSLELMPGDPHSLDYYAKLISGVRSELGRTFDENERQAAELALLRRVAEAAESYLGAMYTDGIERKNLRDALAAWKAGAK